MSDSTETSSREALPRLLYIGDQSVESTVGGAALLYRLLQTYPKDRLRIVESNLCVSRPEARIPGVCYDVMSIGIPRLTRSRLKPYQAAALWWSAPHRIPQIARCVHEFAPEAILTISHMYSWRTAAAAARRLHLPLHLILHDDVVRMSFLPTWLHPRVGQILGRIYGQAASRLCISPYMEEYYALLYGMRGEVVYPSWAADVERFVAPPPVADKSSLVFAYAGSLHGGGYAGDLAPLAGALQSRGHRLMLFSGVSADRLAYFGLDLPNVTTRPFVPFAELLRTLRTEADVLVVPMNFSPGMRVDMELCFPSKLADYTATALPMLIWGPSYCSAVRWGRENSGAAEVVIEEGPAGLGEAINRLESPTHRAVLAREAMAAGRRFFDHATVVAGFQESLLRNFQTRAKCRPC